MVGKIASDARIDENCDSMSTSLSRDVRFFGTANNNRFDLVAMQFIATPNISSGSKGYATCKHTTFYSNIFKSPSIMRIQVLHFCCCDSKTALYKSLVYFHSNKFSFEVESRQTNKSP